MSARRKFYAIVYRGLRHPTAFGNYGGSRGTNAPGIPRGKL